jgi:hypothetical protein
MAAGASTAATITGETGGIEWLRTTATVAVTTTGAGHITVGAVTATVIPLAAAFTWDIIPVITVITVLITVIRT